MAIPSRPVGQDPQSQLLWNISKQMEQLIGQVGALVRLSTPSTSTTTSSTSTSTSSTSTSTSTTTSTTEIPTTTTTTTSEPTTTTTSSTQPLLQVKWQRSDSGNACSSTNYIYLTGSPDLCSATDLYGDFSSIINSGTSPGAYVNIAGLTNGQFRTFQLVDSTRLSPDGACRDCQ